MAIKALFLDAANTLVHKPALYPSMAEVLKRHGVQVDLDVLLRQHRFLSEAKSFPDRTSREFYDEFNSELLRSLGVLPKRELLDELFGACSYLPWRPFDDVADLTVLDVPLGVLSNWNTQLSDTLALIPDLQFSWVLGSEQIGLRKPAPAFFERMLDAAALEASEIAYIGDSMRLDVEPALSMGIRAALIDRDNLYPHANVPRITSLSQVVTLL
ncbi:HAD family hydrolase [Dyella sp.]|jgi:HAD superfamily hydrolase (TIGR01549 family)|uniref:HAD family hydrolase n=1 Tax=Dyella sp. TaxID=1869338 RepID=UPI002D78CBC3|nr:HAD family hydrolase [Dyella sp.]HET6430805.1 HAD family hydrolase [Dyella sp.]